MTTDSVPQSALLAQLRDGLKRRQIHRAIDDLTAGLRRYPLWGMIGFHEMRQRYRRSVLGPFWITISMGVMVLALGLLYGKIFNQDLALYLPFLSAGFVVWGLLSQLILEGSQAFISSEGMMRQLAAPVSLYVYRVVWSNLLIFAHNIWVFVGVAIWFGVDVGWSSLLVIPGLALLLINGVWVGLLFGLLSARFRDVPLILGSIVQVMFFITPVIWRPSMLPERALLLDLNPFFHVIEIVRAPLLGMPPQWENWFASLLITLVGWAVTLVLFATYRWRIAYWV
jgi:ABC-2 type transport system permease protein/lipopolysaccharide transport system permease protein